MAYPIRLALLEITHGHATVVSQLFSIESYDGITSVIYARLIPIRRAERLPKQSGKCLACTQKEDKLHHDWFVYIVRSLKRTTQSTCTGRHSSDHPSRSWAQKDITSYCQRMETSEGCKGKACTMEILQKLLETKVSIHRAPLAIGERSYCNRYH